MASGKFTLKKHKVSCFILANFLSCTFILSACTSNDQSTNIIDPSPTPITDQPIAQWDNQPKGATWTKYTLAAIDQYGTNLTSIIPKDSEKYCNSYQDLNRNNRRAFWVHLLSALAKYESNYDPTVKFDETTVDQKMRTKTGAPIISRGLLQISKESANGYGCKIKDAQQLHDAGTNITCAIRILDRWVARDKVISDRVEEKWKGAARYFSPFRNPTKLKNMQSLSKQLAFCQTK